MEQQQNIAEAKPLGTTENLSTAPLEPVVRPRRTRTLHVGLSVRGALAWDRAEFRRALKWMKREDGTPFESVEQLRDALMDELVAGHEILPFAECDNWDWKEGCRGHDVEA